jgi:CitMHS family citrate-Mg2+:H+ or citrate-Ca2+:H+ symporter
MSSSLLTVYAYGMISVFMTLIMTKRMSVLTALALVPIAFGIHCRIRT